ncbi:MAG: phosphoenolpyruvate carboxykinase, partial [Lachnospiraceae bacterium]|nr:phosphoenolpyruvate carboxykinase [Lachnospiraceae bacterium]
MSTKAMYKISEIGKGKVGFSTTRSIIEGAFYGNNVVKVNTLKEAYNLAKNSPGTVVTDMPIYRGEEFGLDSDAKVLLFNDGAVTGRYAVARRIKGEPGVDEKKLDKVIMDAIYKTRWKKMYHATCYVGLDPEFMAKAHLLIPEGEENLLYNWMLNFQYMSDSYNKMYKESKPIADGNEPDIYIFSDPQWAPVPAPDVDYSC